MTVPCGMMKDLLPLYIDDVCGSESRQAIEQHLKKCDGCRKYYEAMKAADEFDKENSNLEEIKMADSLKRAKSAINKKIKRIIICAVAAAIVFTVGFLVLFNAPLKSVDKDKVKISAKVLPLSESPQSVETDSDSVKISLEEEEQDKLYRLEFPDMPDSHITASEEVIERDGFVTVITASSEYFLRSINWEVKDDTIYISSFKTTVLGNKAKNYLTTSMEFREINKILFVEKGKETTLWEK